MITEQLLLNHGGADQLDRIQSLNLSNLGLTSSSLNDARSLFDKLSSLDELDLSGNNIRDMPVLPLNDCRVLNLAHNNLQDVEFLEDLWTIEEIDLTGNSQIDIIERMKIRVYLPKVNMINGEPTDERDPAITIGDQLRSRLVKLFNENFQEKFNELKSGSSILEDLDEDMKKESDEYQQLSKKFVDRAKKVPAGPGSVRKFRIWLSERIAKEIMEDEKSIKKDEVIFYQKMKKKRKMNPDPVLDKWESKYFPSAALQCHSNDVKDENVQVWNLNFEPVVGKNNATTSIFASVGGDSVCFIDSKSGKVRSKYVKEGEEFFSVAWSYFAESLSQNDTFIAAGGKNGFVYIISPVASSCLYKLKVSRKWAVNVNTIQFCHPIKPDFMFAAGAGKGIFEVTGWKLSRTKAIKLVQLEGLDSTPIRLVVPNKDQELANLMCASETGIKVWNIEDLDPKRKECRELKGTLCHPNLPELNQVDALSQFSDELMVSKCSNSGVIFLWRHNEIINELQNGQSSLIEPIKIFNWSNTNELYINLNTSINNQSFLTGDEKGRIWIYKPDLDGPEMQDAHEIVPFPTVNRENGLASLSETILNDVIMSSDGRFIAAGTNNNLVLILKQTN